MTRAKFPHKGGVMLVIKFSGRAEIVWELISCLAKAYPRVTLAEIIKEKEGI
jgi:hypothetical protein